MTRKATKTVTTVTEEPIEGNPPEETPQLSGFEAEEDTKPDEIAEFLERFGQECYIRVYRIERTGDRAFLAKVEPKFWSEEWLQEVYGEGRYVIQIISENRIRATRHIVMGPSANKPIAPATGSMLPNPPATIPVLGDSTGSLQMQILMQEMAANREIMLEMIRAQKPASGIGDILEVVTALKAMNPPQTNGAGSMESLMSILKTGIELGQTGTIDTSKEKGMMGMIKDALPIVGDVIKGFMPQRQPEAQPLQMHPASPHQQIAGVDERALQMLQHGINYLKSKIMQGKSVELYADFILDSLEDPQWQPFIRLAQVPYEEFAKLDPELLQLPYKPWFEKLFSTVKEALSAPPEPDGETDGSIPSATS